MYEEARKYRTVAFWLCVVAFLCMLSGPLAGSIFLAHCTGKVPTLWFLLLGCGLAVPAAALSLFFIQRAEGLEQKCAEEYEVAVREQENTNGMGI